MNLNIWHKHIRIMQQVIYLCVRNLTVLNRMRRAVLILMSLLLPVAASAQLPEYLPEPVLGNPSGTAPYFFGPSAFPVPDMLKNTSGRFSFRLNGAYSAGHLAETQDRTATLGFRIVAPLWTERANLSVFGQIHEWYRDTPEARSMRKVSPEYALDGHCAGDVYFSVDMRVLQERRILPCLTLRAALKSASGDDYEKARFYDAPGYFFDACVTKSLQFLQDGFFKSLSASASAGFLCWQTDIGCQNDAAMYAGSLELDTRLFDASVELGGYRGREKYHDSPVTCKFRIEFRKDSPLSPMLQYQVGLRDWPFNQLMIGLTYSPRKTISGPF